MRVAAKMVRATIRTLSSRLIDQAGVELHLQCTRSVHTQAARCWRLFLATPIRRTLGPYAHELGRVM